MRRRDIRQARFVRRLERGENARHFRLSHDQMQGAAAGLVRFCQFAVIVNGRADAETTDEPQGSVGRYRWP